MPPASTVTTDSFLESVRNSRLTGEENIRLAVANVQADSVEAIADALVKKGILNTWQGRYLMAGQPGLRIGNYILQGRVGQDSLGERFFAVQETLGRTVDLQLLPESLVAEQTGMDRFLESASQLTHLDHHAIVHLYDVADHHGQLFIVSEHCEPMTADEFRSVPEVGLAHLRAVRDLCEGIRYLHDQDLSHGFLEAENSIRIARPGVIKLDRLAWSVLQRELVSRSLIETFEQRRTADWKQIGNFAARLLAAAPIDRALSQPNRDSLVSAFQALATSPEPDVRAQMLSGKISGLIDRIEKRALPANSPGKAAVATGAEAKAGKNRSSTGSGRTAAASNADSSQPKNRQSTGTASRGVKSAGRNGIPKIASIASLVLLACVVGWFAWGKFGSNPDRESAQRQPSSTKTKNTERPTVPRVESPKPAGPKPADSTEPETPPPVPTPAGSSTTAEIKKSPEDLAVTVDPASAISPPGEPPATGVDGKSAGISGTTGDPAVPEDSPGLVAKPVDSGEKSSEAQQSGSQLQDSASQPENSATAAPAWPKSFALSDGTHHEPQVIGKLPVNPAGEVAVSFVYDSESSGRGKNFFVAQGSGRNWKIAWSKKGDKEELETVASLNLDDSGELVFQWADSIDDKHPANYIVNSAIKLQSGGLVNQTWLRETIPFDALKLDPESLESSIKLEIPWMPRADNVVIEFGELRADQGWTVEAMLENETFSNREPARIFFRSLPEERFLWLAIDGRVRGKVEMGLTVQTIAAGRLANMKRHELDAFINAFRANHEALVIRENQAQIAADNAPYGSKTKTKDAATQARKDTAAGKVQRDLAFEYQAWIEGLIGKPVPLRVMYQVGEQSIELARSSGWDLPPAAANETKKD